MRGNQAKFRRECFEKHKWQGPLGRWYLTCADCDLPFEPARDKYWEADHRVPVGLDGPSTPENSQPLCGPCHKAKTHGIDRPAIQKSKDVRDKHFGIKRKSGFYRPPGHKYQWGRRDD